MAAFTLISAKYHPLAMTVKFNVSFSNILVSIFILFSIGLTSCNEDRFSTNPSDRLEFSTDTLSFDTVFTTIGSATSKILVYNRNNSALNISQIHLAGGKNSSFRINVDGSLNEYNQFADIEIRAHDSLYIFVQVTVDVSDPQSPMFIEDSLIFSTNGVNQNVKLQAYGQDMEPLKNLYIQNDTVLTAKKPYLVYGYLAIDTAKTLTLMPGCKLFFHNNANLIVYGNLKAEGTAAEPIIMRGDRLDKIKFETPFPYNNVAGQWGGIYLLWKGGKHVLKHVNMNSGYVGIYFSNNDKNTLPRLDITDSRIHNFLLYGLVVQNGNVTVVNTEISNSSSYTVYLNGGKHTFIQSTIANYFNNSNVQPVTRDKKPAVMIMNLNRIAPMETVFRNCVISGSAENEFSLASRFMEQYNGIFNHCYIRKPDSLKLNQFTNIRWSEIKDTVFKDTRYDYIKNTYFNFTPDSVSPARGLADKTIASQYPLDLNGNNRMDDGEPDAGAYEWKPVK
ncbi:MAG: right-handed parallel beta-helix repeat-containing protein [Paludibacter sp.]|nr:right-handed parallel beta-helix repeat-containing protein [Paludibacter sp.]